MDRLIPVLIILGTLGTLGLALSPDGKALLLLKSSLQGNLSPLEDWSPSDPTPCSWTGVGCNTLHQVICLSLGAMNLSGSIHPLAISSLSSLSNLSLELNNFTNTQLPSEIFTPSLTFLNISHSNFTSAFPSNLSSARSLRILDAYNNNFDGFLPLGLSSLPNLTHLHLGGSLFSGPIPPEYGFIRSLRFLALSGNELTGPIPPELGHLENLEHLYLGYYNNYTGGIPRELGRLKNLRLLDLALCGLDGSIPPELGSLRRLDSLFLQLNSLTGPIPESIGRLSGLKSLDLSCNLLTGRISLSLEKLVQLELLSLFENDLGGEIPSFIGDLPNLEVIYLWRNGFQGPIPSQLGGNKRLMKLDLSKNNLTGTIPSSLCDSERLDTLILQQNRLTGSIPDSLGSCSSLEKIRLGDNLLTGSIPPGLFSLPELTMMELMRNRLNGLLPTSAFFSARSKLSAVDLSENLLRGELPEEIFTLSDLQQLYISWNRLSGAVPPSLGKLRWLSRLNVSHNLLTGGIPDEIGDCEALEIVDLSMNQLSGEIPPSLGKLPALDVLNLSRNLFSGPVPATGRLDADYSFNRLSGPIPEVDVFNVSSYIGNLGLCGYTFGPCKGGPYEGNGNGYSINRGGGGGGGKKNEAGLLAWLVGALFSAALLVLVIGICCFFKKYRHYICGFIRRDSVTSSSKKTWKLTKFQRLEFSASQLLECMNEDNIIGRGGSGTVYKGVMPSGEVVAVKKLSSFTVPLRKGGGGGGLVSSHSDHGFSAEIQTLGKIRHRNIVKLLGFCSNKETNVLVYEYLPNGSLGEALHGKKGALLDWGIRYKIAVQAANGLCYLHHDCSPLIVHRDVKSNNILLDEHFQAHVADFGLAKLFQDSGKSESMSSIAGSYGYIAPEYAYTLKVNEKSDIYSFGVVLLELVTGRRPIEAEYGDGVDIVQWVRRKIQSKDGVMEVLDTRIGDDNPPVQEIMLVLRVALLCTSDLPVDRPTMRDVVQMLSDAKPGKGKEGESEIPSESLCCSQTQLLPPV